MSLYNICSAEIYNLIEDEAEAISQYYNFLDKFYQTLSEKEIEIIYNIIEEEKRHIINLQNIQER